MKNLKFLLIVFLVQLPLVGCTQGFWSRFEEGQRKERAEYEAKKQSDEVIRQAQIQSTCDRYGFKRGTNEYSNCLMQVDQSSNNEVRSNNNETQQRQQQLLKQSAELLKPPEFQNYAPACLTVGRDKMGQIAKHILLY